MNELTVDIIAEVLGRYRFSITTEDELQHGIADALTLNKIGFVREHRLKRGPVDFYLPGSRIAIEAKTQGSPAEVTQQLLDYLDESKVAGILLVTRRKALAHLPIAILGKPVRALWVGGNSL